MAKQIGIAAQNPFDFEEGTWLPIDGSGAGLVLDDGMGSPPVGYFIRIGKVIWASALIVYPVTVNGADNRIDGLPYSIGTGLFAGIVSQQTLGTPNLIGKVLPGLSFVDLATGARLANSVLSSGFVDFMICYTMA